MYFFLGYKTFILTAKHLDTTTKYKGGKKKLILNSTTVNIAAFFFFFNLKRGFQDSIHSSLD